MLTNTLRRVLEEQRWSHAEAARRIGLTPIAFYQKMVGFRGRKFWADEQARLAELTGWPVEKLFPDVAIAEVVEV